VRDQIIAAATRWMLRTAFVGVVVLGFFAYRYRHDVVADFMFGVRVLFAVVAALWLARIAVSLYRFGRASKGAKLNYPRMLVASWRWRWLTRNLGIAYPDPHDKKTVHRGALGPTLGPNTRVEYPKARIRYPRAVFRADEFGLIAYVRTTPKAGRAEFEKHTDHIADAWGCHRVQVSQPEPGRLTVRGMLTDPLAVPFGPELAPRGTYTEPNPVMPYLGRDEWGQHRYANLTGVTGIAIGGMPDYGKTSLVLNLLVQLAATGAVQFVFIDGKGGGDYLSWYDRAWLTCGHNPEHAADTWSQVEDLMHRRLAAVGTVGGPRNRWHAGPTPDYPLIVTVADECHSFFDLEAARGHGKDAESWVRQCRGSASQLVRMGRSVLFLNLFITQKQTSDAIPTAIRDICGLRFSFATQTRDAAVAALGEHIKEYPSVDPTTLQDKPTYVGVCTTNLKTGSDPFTRLRVPEISEAAADARAIETAAYRSDPVELLDTLLAPRLAAVDHSEVA
jgi:DNA segregation ATPase FtsK/SpoIIIE, S-DNA-T family